MTPRELLEKYGTRTIENSRYNKYLDVDCVVCYCHYKISLNNYPRTSIFKELRRQKNSFIKQLKSRGLKDYIPDIILIIKNKNEFLGLEFDRSGFQNKLINIGFKEALEKFIKSKNKKIIDNVIKIYITSAKI